MMKDVVIQGICERINKARYFSIISDSKQDSGKTETAVLLTHHIEDLNGDITSAFFLYLMFDWRFHIERDY